MPLKKPLPILVPQRLRKVPRSFAWIDHRLRSEGFLERLRPEDLGLYLISYRPWRRDEPDGCYQVLSVERLQAPVSPDLMQLMSKVFQRLEAPSVQP